LLADVEKIAGDDNPLELLFMKGSSWPVSAESEALPVDIALWRATDNGEKVFLDYGSNPESMSGKPPIEIPLSIETFYGSKGLPRDSQGNFGRPLNRLFMLNRTLIQWFVRQGYDFKSEYLEVSHAAQHFLGGIHINTRAETGVAGLYACGEAAGGQHGANRPGGNSLLDCQVMGHIAGIEASNFASGVETEPITSHAEKFISEMISKLYVPDGVDPVIARDFIKKTLTKNVGAIRVKSRLQEAADELSELTEKGVNVGNNPIHHALIARSMQVIGLCIATSALNRNESRGSHVLLESEFSNRVLPMREPEGRFLNRVKMIDGELVFDKLKTESFKKN
ncbi:MAG: FAD-binding protein, partial [bacterium]